MKAVHPLEEIKQLELMIQQAEKELEKERSYHNTRIHNEYTVRRNTLIEDMRKSIKLIGDKDESD